MSSAIAGTRDNANAQGTGTPYSYYESQPGKRHIILVRIGFLCDTKCCCCLKLIRGWVVQPIVMTLRPWRSADTKY